MAEKINDGGCAFQSESMNGVDRDGNRMPFSPGMSLRDWFAGQALPAVISLIGIPEDGPDELWDAAIARQARSIADAMLNLPAKSDEASL